MRHEIIMSGFGGQGVMVMGQLLTYAGMLENKRVSWIPSYGPEMRGGTANCSIIISDEAVGSPIVTEPTAVVTMNAPSLDKFTPLLQSGGTLVINKSLIDCNVDRQDIVAYEVSANEIANDLGNGKAANMVALGALNAALGFIVETPTLIKAFEKMFAKKPALIELNERAIRAGEQAINR